MAKPPRLSAPKIKYDMSPKAVLGRAERIQKMEAGERMLMKRKPVEVIRTTVRMKETPVKKK